MSRIDVENAKQIRNPMDVLITMEVPATDITLTYSGYSSAKVADGILGEPTWPMRGLADLQGDGFPLDGSRVLYDPNTPASAANGKIGIRSNIGEPVSVTVTGNRTITSLSIFASGAESVAFGGTTTPMIAGSAVIPVGARSITLTLSPASSTERIEVSEIRPGTVFRINNDNLIRAVVSLRSDLSIINPTLPESEINIDVYQDTDIAKIVANIPEGTPITYQAGYPGDMSPVRKFYLTGQVTWEDNVLSIQGVDAVHFLDETNIYPIVVGSESSYGEMTEDNSTLNNLDGCFKWVINFAGVTFADDAQSLADYADTRLFVICRQSARDLMAAMMWVLHIDAAAADIGGQDNKDGFWPTYVDAGIPTYRNYKPSPKWTILEEDAADVSRSYERRFTQVTLDYNNLTETNQETGGGTGETGEVGSADWLYNIGAFPNFEDYVTAYRPRYNSHLITSTRSDYDSTDAISLPIIRGYYGSKLLGPDIPSEWMAPFYTQMLPWTDGTGSTSQKSVWDAYVGASTDNQTVSLMGTRMLSEKKTARVNILGITGVKQEITTPAFDGWLSSGPSDQSFTRTHWFPDEVLTAIIRRAYSSNVTGSFRWKGDPRHQPRDVATFVLRDGAEETITLENITITHEGGGTYADYTYRKGIV